MLLDEPRPGVPRRSCASRPGGTQDDIGGFALYTGRLDALQAFAASDEYEAIYFPALQILTNLQTRFFVGGTDQEVMRIIGEAVQQWQAAGVMKG